MRRLAYSLLNIALLTLPCFAGLANSGQSQTTVRTQSKYLSVITSANAESNAARSFIIPKDGILLKEGIKNGSIQKIIGQQTPFVIEYTRKLKQNINFQWIIETTNKKHGTIKLLSKFKGKGRLLKSAYKWKSEILDKSVDDRHRLVFRPKPNKHLPSRYKKGRGPEGKRTRRGGGTRKINRHRYNPQYAYDITVHIFRDEKRIFTHRTRLEMDHKDMIRQEYINHHNIRHYKDPDRGIIPIPKRSEITELPQLPVAMEGNPLTESKYNLIINDGMSKLANNINNYYMKNLKKIRSRGGILDINKKRRKVPFNKLWISSGWRNPERNEWYSNIVNGKHQQGGAVDIIIMSPSSSLESAIGYWVLWKTLKKYKKQIKGTWQLESNGTPMKRKEYWQDVDPKNGIPDAFDRADHLHANVRY